MSMVRADKKLPAGILAILLGGLGVHKFFLGRTRAGLITLGLYGLGLATTCIGVGGFILGVLHVVALVEGIIYLTKSDSDFYLEYIVGRKEWF